MASRDLQHFSSFVLLHYIWNLRGTRDKVVVMFEQSTNSEVFHKVYRKNYGSNMTKKVPEADPSCYVLKYNEIIVRTCVKQSENYVELY